MGDLIYLDLHRPRIKIVRKLPPGSRIPEWFLDALVGKIFLINQAVETTIHFSGEEQYGYSVRKIVAYNVLKRRCPRAAKFLKENSHLFPKPNLYFDESSCELIGSRRKLTLTKALCSFLKR